MGQSVSDGIRPKIAKASLDYDRLLLGQSSLLACEAVTTGLQRTSDTLGLEAKPFRSSRSASASEADGLIDMRTAGKHVQLAS